MTTENGTPTMNATDALAEAMRGRLADLAGVAGQLDGLLDHGPPPFLLARAALAVDAAAADLGRHAEALGLAVAARPLPPGEGV